MKWFLSRLLNCRKNLIEMQVYVMKHWAMCLSSWLLSLPVPCDAAGSYLNPAAQKNHNKVNVDRAINHSKKLFNIFFQFYANLSFCLHYFLQNIIKFGLLSSCNFPAVRLCSLEVQQSTTTNRTQYNFWKEGQQSKNNITKNNI